MSRNCCPAAGNCGICTDRRKQPSGRRFTGSRRPKVPSRSAGRSTTRRCSSRCKSQSCPNGCRRGVVHWGCRPGARIPAAPRTDSGAICSQPVPGRQSGFRTGDLARWRADATLECLGRVDHQVKIRGFRIELGEIESVLGRHPGVRQCAVAACDDADGGQRLVAYYEPHSESTPAVADLRAHLRQSLPEYMVPSAFVESRISPLPQITRSTEKPYLGPRGNPFRNRPATSRRETLWNRLSPTSGPQVLGVPKVGLDDDFFDSGGALPCRGSTPRRDQDHHWTGAASGDLIPGRDHRAFARPSALRDRWKPSGPHWCPFSPSEVSHRCFWCTARKGTSCFIVNLHIEPDRPVYGLQAQGLDGESPILETVEEMAAQYVKEIQVVQPTGPYFLAGYCLGGTVAFEMAQQLKALGKSVGAVFLLDSYNGGILPWFQSLVRKPLHSLQNAWFHAANVLSVSKGDRVKFIREKMHIAGSRFAVRMQALQHAVSRSAGLDAHNLYPHLKVVGINDRAADRYNALPYEGRLVLVRSKGHFSGFTDPYFGWKDVAKSGLEVHLLPVYQRGMLIEPFCRFLAEVLGNLLGSKTTGSELPKRFALGIAVTWLTQVLPALSSLPRCCCYNPKEKDGCEASS